MLRRAYAEWLLEKLRMEQRFATSVLYDELKKVNSSDDYYEAKRRLGLNIDLGHWVAGKIMRETKKRSEFE